MTRLAPIAMVAALLGFLAACLASPGMARAQDAPLPFKVELIDTGIYEVGGVEVRAAPGTASGKVATLEEIRLIQITSEVPAKLGSTFGFRYRLLGVPEGPLGSLSMRALHPPMRGPDGRVTSTSSADTEVDGVRGVGEGAVAYTLSEPFEVLRGTWELQLLYKGKPVLARTFVLK